MNKLAEFSEEARKLALERFRMFRPHLEINVLKKVTQDVM
jgi:hypothetical protein